MKLQFIGAENIFSFKSVELDLSSSKFTCITGENRDSNDSNGSGKSSLLSIPRLVLFKKSSKRNFISDWATKGKASIVLDDMLIERQFPGDKILLNGSPTSQEEINQVVGISDDIFRNTVFYEQGVLNRFAESTSSEQLKIITNILPELVLFDKVRELVLIDVNEFGTKANDMRSKIEEAQLQVEGIDEKKMKHDYDEWNDNIQAAKKEISNHQSAIDRIHQFQVEATKKDAIIQRMKKITEDFNIYKKALVELKQKTESHKEQLAKCKITDTGINNLRSNLSNLEQQAYLARELAMSYQKAIELDTEQCPTCFSKIDKKAQWKILDPLLKEEQKKVINLNAQIQKNKETLVQYEVQLQESRVLIKSIDANEIAKRNLDTLLSKLKKEYDELKIECNSIKAVDYSEEDLKNAQNALKLAQNKHQKASQEALRLKIDLQALQDAQKRLKTLTDALNSIKNQAEIADYWYKQMPVLKVRVIDTNIALMESILNDYMLDLYPSHRVRIETTSTLKSGEVRDKIGFTIMTKEYQRAWDDLSGGEKTRVALGCQIAMRSLLKTKIRFECYDEIFGALGDGGVEAVINLLKRRSDEGTQIFAISHSQEVNSYFDSNIHVIKEGGISHVDQC